MNKMNSIVAYFCRNYPYKEELSKARLTKLVYLADWFSALADNHQMTDINWVFNHYGPYVDDVINSIQCCNLMFKIDYSLNTYGSEKGIISYIGNERDINLSDREKEILDLVINKTSSMFFNDFIDYVYSTYPVKSSNRYSHLNLVNLAKDYKNVI
ncbi:Panacea domain-containing protein [Pasteurella multocida]